MQKNGALLPYTTSKGHNIALLRHGLFNIPEMFSAEHSDVRLTTWKLRGAGVFLLYVSAVCLAKLLKIFCKSLTLSFCKICINEKEILLQISI